MEFKVIDIEEIDIEDLSDEIYSLKEDKQKSLSIFEQLRENGELIEGDFDSDKWVFLNRLNSQNINFDFTTLKPYFLFNKKRNVNEFTQMVKCWLIHKLVKYEPQSCRNLYSFLLETIYYTNGFSSKELTSFLDDLKGSDKSPAAIKNIVKVALNFLDYTDLPECGPLIKELSSINENASR